MTVVDDLKHVARELRSLLDAPVRNQEEVKAWQDKADKFRGLLSSKGGNVATLVLHQVDHFLTDVDVRRRDAEYARWQEGQVRDMIERLEKGTP